MKLKNTLAAMAGLGLAAITTVASAETWRIGLEEPKGSVTYEYAQQFKKLIEERSDGDVTVQILPYGTWGSVYSALYDAVQNGSIQIAFGSGALGATVPESQLLTLNYVMPDDRRKTTRALNSDAFLHSNAWEESFKERGLYPIAVLPQGYQVWATNKPIRTPEDWEGVRLRVMDNSLLVATYRAYGANSSTMAYGELYSALQQGQLEAIIQPLFAHENMSFYEVVDYLIFADQAQFISAEFVNLDWYQGLSDERKKMIDKIADELVQYGYDVQAEMNEKRLEIMKEKGDIEIIRLTEEQRDQFRKIAKPLRQEYVDQVGERGKEALNILLEQLDK